MKKKVAVVLVAHGEAESAGFFENYLVSRHTMAHAGMVMHIPTPVQVVISFLGGVINSIKGNTSGFTSPHNENTRLQAAAITEKLKSIEPETNCTYKVYTTFLSSKPFFEEELKEIVQNEYVIFVSLSTIESRLTCGIICDEMMHYRKDMDLLKTKVISQHWQNPDFTELVINHIFGDRKFESETDESKALLLVFHGTLVKDKYGNPPGFHAGLEETLTYAEELKSKIEKDPRNFYGHVSAAYLNHEVGGVWTQPSLKNALLDLKAKKIKHIGIFPCGFMVDGAETLDNAKKSLIKSGIDGTAYIVALNQDPNFIDYLVGRIKKASQQFEVYTKEEISSIER